jgi:hypothetical protein
VNESFGSNQGEVDFLGSERLVNGLTISCGLRIFVSHDVHLNLFVEYKNEKLYCLEKPCRHMHLALGATGEELRSLSWRFSIGKSTACMLVNDVCEAIVRVLLPLYVQWPGH